MGEPSYKALLIGNSTFPADSHNLQTLEGPVNDVALLRSALTDPDTGMFRQPGVRMVPERTSAEILQELEQFFTSASRTDVLLFYYSGHGLLDERGQLFLCARDSRTDLLRSTSISSTAINMMFEASAARTTVILIDCCHAGAFKGTSLPESLHGVGRYVMTSCRSGQLANDAHQRNHTSLFTQHVVEGLSGAAEDRNGDGYIDLDELFDYVRDRLVAENRQIPQRHFAGHGDVAIARQPPGGAAAATPATSSQTAPHTAPESQVSAERIEAALDFGVLTVGEPSPRQRVRLAPGAKGTREYVVDEVEPWVRVERQGDAVVVSVDTSSPGRLAGAVLVTAGEVEVCISVRAVIVDSAPPLPEGAPAPPRRGRAGGELFRRRNVGVLAVLAVAAVVVAAVGFFGGGADDRPSSRTTAASAAGSTTPTAEVRPFPPGQADLTAGSYVTSTFNPRFTVILDPGWTLQRETRDDIELSRSDGVVGSITVFSPSHPLRRDRLFRTLDEAADDSSAEPPVTDVITWLRSDTRLILSNSTQTTTAGMTVTHVDVTPKEGYETDYCGSPCVPLFEVGDGGVFVLPEGITTRLAAVPVGTEQVLIAIEAPAERFPQLEAKAGPFLSTIAFAP